MNVVHAIADDIYQCWLPNRICGWRTVSQEVPATWFLLESVLIDWMLQPLMRKFVGSTAMRNFVLPAIAIVLSAANPWKSNCEEKIHFVL